MNERHFSRTAVVLIGVVGVVLAVWPWGCTPAVNSWPDAENKPKVLVSFAPLYCFALNVGGDDVALKSLLTTRGPHDYPYDARDLLMLRKADLFLVNGMGLDEDFSRKLASNCGNTKLKLVELAEVAIPKEKRLELNLKHGDHVHEGDDPHVWLGIPEAIEIVNQIAVEFKAIDPTHADKYDARAKQYTAKLGKLLEDGRKDLAGKPEDKRIITTHDAFQYFARSFGVEIVGFIQPVAGRGLDAKDFQELVEKCKDKVVRAITTEPQYPTADSEALLNAVGNKLKGQPRPHLAELDPLETADPTELTPDWYERKMRENVANLVAAFKKFGSEK